MITIVILLIIEGFYGSWAFSSGEVRSKCWVHLACRGVTVYSISPHSNPVILEFSSRVARNSLTSRPSPLAKASLVLRYSTSEYQISINNIRLKCGFSNIIVHLHYIHHLILNTRIQAVVLVYWFVYVARYYYLYCKWARARTSKASEIQHPRLAPRWSSNEIIQFCKYEIALFCPSRPWYTRDTLLPILHHLDIVVENAILHICLRLRHFPTRIFRGAPNLRFHFRHMSVTYVL